MSQKLSFKVIMGLSLAALGGWSFAEEVNQPTFPIDTATEQAKPLDAFVTWDDKLKNILMEQLAAIGYEEKAMAEEAQTVNTIKDKDARQSAEIDFYAKYQTLALQGLRRMATLAKSTEADALIDNLEKALHSLPTIEGDVPTGIALIYEQMPDAVFSLADDNPCVTPMIRLGCLFALLSNRECAYVSFGPTVGPIATGNLLTAFFPTPTDDGWLYDSGRAYVNWNRFSGGNYYIAHGTQYTNFDHDGIYQAGFHWPIKPSDHMMCIDMQLFRLSNRSMPPLEPLSDISAKTFSVGYARVTSAWSLSLDGYGMSQPASPASNCSFVHEVQSGTFIKDAGDSIYATSRGDREPSQRRQACWFRNLDDIYSRYSHSQPRQGFPVNSNDLDTFNAADATVTSRLSTSQYHWGDVEAYERTGINIYFMGILMVRDRQ